MKSIFVFFCLLLSSAFAYSAQYKVTFSGAVNSNFPAFGLSGPLSSRKFSGQVLLDTDLGGADVYSHSKSLSEYRGNGNWIDFSFNHSVPFNFNAVIPGGVHKDSVGLSDSSGRGATDSFTVKSLFSSDPKGECGGVSRPAEYCYLITLNLYPKDGKITWGQEMTLGKEDFGATGSLTAYLINYDPVNGFVADAGSVRTMELDNYAISTVAPVPLPAAAWMFLMALGSFAGLRLRKRTAI